MNAEGGEVIQQSNKNDARTLREKLDHINRRWDRLCQAVLHPSDR